jgi:hypothetical protein
VTVRGLSMRHAASDAQGAISNDGYSAWTLERSHLADAHGALVGVDRGIRVTVRQSTLERAGQTAVAVSGATQVELVQNTITESNTEAFRPDEGAGGIVIDSSTQVVASQNEIAQSAGVGLECRIDCADVVFAQNRVHHAAAQGVHLGMSTRGELRGNVIWESGWGDSDWGWGAGLLVWCSSHVQVRDNLVAWSPDGITVMSQWQSNPAYLVTQVLVENNQVVGADDPTDVTLWRVDLGWLEDWAGAMFDASSGNRGVGNRFWNAAAERSDVWRFSWGSSSSGVAYLTQFASTPGGEGSAYLTLEEKDAVLTQAGVPIFPEPH